MRQENSLDSVVAFFVSKISGQKLAEFARAAHHVEISKSIQEMANRANILVGRHPVQSLSYQDKMILALYERFNHLIPKNYLDAGVEMAEHDGKKPVFYDPRTGTVYTLN